MAPISPREREQREKRQLQTVRDKFFKGADSSQVSDERAFRRLTQDRAEQNFKDRFTRPVGGSKTNLLQMTADAPRSLAAERERLANLYGPTLGEIGGDFMRGLGNVTREMGVPVVSSINRVFNVAKSGVEQLWDKVRGETPTQVGTAFPTPRSDVRDFFSSVNTGIAASDPNNLLVQIAMANQDKFNNTPTFQEQLTNATAQDNDLLLQPIVNLQNQISNFGDTRFGKFGVENLLTGKPTATFNTDIFGGQLGITANPIEDQYGFKFTKAFNRGGSVNKNSGLGYMLK